MFAIDSGLVCLDVHLAQWTWRHNHVGTVTRGRFHNVTNLLLALFMLREGQCAAATGDFLFVLGGSFRSCGFHQFVEMNRILKWSG